VCFIEFWVFWLNPGFVRRPNFTSGVLDSSLECFDTVMACGVLQLFVGSVRYIRRTIATLGKVDSRMNFNKVSKFSTKMGHYCVMALQ